MLILSNAISFWSIHALEVQIIEAIIIQPHICEVGGDCEVYIQAILS